MRINIGLIDFGYRLDDINSLLKLEDCINYAVVGEELGYDKFWLGEHHMPKRTLAWNNPATLIPVLATHTQKISIGTAGTLICIHNPYHIASTFKFLNNIFPKRIELGFANGTPYEGVAAYTTGKTSTQAVQEFEDKVCQTVALLRKEEEFFLRDGLVFPPYKGLVPKLWTLGSSEKNVISAIELGTNLCFWTTPGLDPKKKERFQTYRTLFFEKYHSYPKLRAVINGVCHTTEQKAKAIAVEQGDESKALYGSASRFSRLYC